MAPQDGRNGGQREKKTEDAWKEVVEIGRAALAVADLGGPSGKEAGILFQRAMWGAYRITPRRPSKLEAAELRRLGWTHADIASELGITEERAREIVSAQNAAVHVRAMRTSKAASIDRWPLERANLAPAVERALVNYSVMTVGHLLVLNRETLEAMHLSNRVIRAVLKAIDELSGSHAGRGARGRTKHTTPEPARRTT